MFVTGKNRAECNNIFRRKRFGVGIVAFVGNFAPQI